MINRTEKGNEINCTEQKTRNNAGNRKLIGTNEKERLGN